MSDLVRKAVKEHRHLVFWYKHDGVLVQREVKPVVFGTDKNGVLKVRAFEDNVPKLWVVENMQGVELGTVYTQNETVAENNIVNVLEHA